MHGSKKEFVINHLSSGGIIWISDFFPEIDAFDDCAADSLSEYEEKYGSDYIRQIPFRYWVHFGRRALKTHSSKLNTRSLASILSENPRCIHGIIMNSHDVIYSINRLATGSGFRVQRSKVIILLTLNC